MSLTRRVSLVLGCLTLAVVWSGGLGFLPFGPFSRHMVMHMCVVAIAAPLLAFAVSNSALDPVRRVPQYCSAIAASMLEFVVVWAWHVPALHHAAAHNPWLKAVEQGLFLATGWLLWIAVLGGTQQQRTQRSMHGVIGLLLTFMHMTLLGVVITLAPRELYAHSAAADGAAATDQQWGGVAMIVLGAASYLGVALWLMQHALLPHSKEER